GAPGDVEPGHRIAVSACVVAAPLGPADHREGLQAAGPQPGAFLVGGEVDVGLGPLAGPVVLRPVEAGGAQPVLPRQFVAVPDAQPSLFGAVDEEQSAEGPVGLPAEVGGVLLVDDQHPAAAVDQLAGGDEAGQPGAHHDDISVCHDRNVSGPDAQAASVRTGSGSQRYTVGVLRCIRARSTASSMA